jgi:hypothetical protein
VLGDRGDRVTRRTTAGDVVGVAAVAAVAPYEHARALVEARGEAGRACRLVPLMADGLTYASSVVMLDCAPECAGAPYLPGGCQIWDLRDAHHQAAHGLGMA